MVKLEEGVMIKFGFFAAGLLSLSAASPASVFEQMHSAALKSGCSYAPMKEENMLQKICTEGRQASALQVNFNKFRQSGSECIPCTVKLVFYIAGRETSAIAIPHCDPQAPVNILISAKATAQKVLAGERAG
jgi:hypothetical protein